MRRLFNAPVVPGSNEHLELLKVELEKYFAGSLRSFSVPLTYPGTKFQRRVWEQLLAIPFGETRSYQELAVAVGAPRAVRAVGRANFGQGVMRVSSNGEMLYTSPNPAASGRCVGPRQWTGAGRKSGQGRGA